MAKEKESDGVGFVTAKYAADKSNKSSKKELVLVASESKNIARISSGIPGIDRITLGGYPIARITQIIGPDKCGKTTSVYVTIASVQKAHPDRKCLFVDTEGTFDPIRASEHGVNLDMLYLSQPDNLEEAFLVLRQFLVTDVTLIVLDSVAMCYPDKVMVNDVGECEVAPIARFLNMELPKLKPFLKRTQAAIIFINQLREKIGGFTGWGDNTHPPGGRQLAHSTSLVLKMARRGPIKVSDDEVGQIVKVKVDKSKVCPMSASCEVNLIYERGFIENSDLERVKKEVRKEHLAKLKASGADLNEVDEEDGD